MHAPLAERLLHDSGVLLALVSIGTIALFARKRLVTKYPLLISMLGVQLLAALFSTAILFYRHQLGLNIDIAYNILFYSHWSLFACQAVLQVLIIYNVFRNAMKPLEGLQELGKVIFRWVAGVSIIVSLAFAAGPHSINADYSITSILATIITQIQQGVSVLTLCLLLFVTFSTKPLGLTYRSREFGIVCGLGVMSCTTLIQAAWSSVAPSQSLYSPVVVFGIMGCIAAMGVWTVYFVMPEPERKMVLLPTTSPFFFWNRISEALGDSPGHVAIAGFRPDMLASAELEMLTAPSVEVSEPVVDRPFATPVMPALLTGSR